MKAEARNLLGFMQTQSIQMLVPIYQRTYCWNRSQCKQLWDDIYRAGENDHIKGHFIGSIVYLADDEHMAAGFKEYLVIDGQQRLTTATLLLEALARRLDQDDEATSKIKNELEINGTKIRNLYLCNSNEEGNKRHRLLPTKSDKDSLLAILNNRTVSPDSSTIGSNFRFFQQRISELGDNLQVLYRGIQKLKIVEIALKREDDDPQLIFESLNSTGLGLTETDLIRNFILMDMKPDIQKNVYGGYWYPMEQSFLQRGEEGIIDKFFRDYLTTKLLKPPKKGDNEIYKEFKKFYVETVDRKNDKEVEDSIKELTRMAGFYAAIIGLPDKQTEKLQKEFPKLNQALADLRLLKADPTNSFLLQVYDLFESNQLSENDFVEVVRLIESYVFRRTICGYPSNGLNKLFPALFSKLDSSNFLENLKAYFCLLDNRNIFPPENDFIAKFAQCDLYRLVNNRCRYTLFRLENSESRETITDNSDITIEHVLPQKIEKVPKWQDALGDNWEALHCQWVNTVGNLTLTGYNGEYSNKPFLEKKRHPNGYLQSKFALTKEIAKLDEWTVATIESRGENLAIMATQLWPYPTVIDEILDKYRTKKTSSSREETFEIYTLDDEENFYTNQKILAFTFLGNKSITLIWTDMFKEVLKALHQYDSTVMPRLVTETEGIGSSVKSERLSNTDYEVATGIYIGTATSTDSKIWVLRQLFPEYRLSGSELEIELQ